MEAVKFEGRGDPQAGRDGQRCVVQPGDVPAIARCLNKREREIYDVLKDGPLHPVIPKFLGVHKEGGKDYIIVDDLMKGFQSPCFCDFKVGTRHFDLDADAAKKEKSQKK